MKTQIEQARDGAITAEMKQVAGDENLCQELIRERVANGEIVIPNNPNRRGQKAVGIGKGLRVLKRRGVDDVELEPAERDLIAQSQRRSADLPVINEGAVVAV